MHPKGCNSSKGARALENQERQQDLGPRALRSPPPESPFSLLGRSASEQFLPTERSFWPENGVQTEATMLQHGIPAHIADSARCLFRECLRRADFVGNQHGNKEVLRSLVREQFRRNMHETDPQRIEEQKQAAARALFNHMYYEASRMAAEQKEDELIKESLLGLPKPALGRTLQDEDNTASS